MLRKAISICLVAVFITFFLDRLPVLRTFINNAPGKLETVAPHRFVEPLKADIKNCEDAVMVRDAHLRVAVLSCDPSRDTWNPIMGITDHAGELSSQGRLIRYKYDDRDMALYDEIELIDYPDYGEFHPLGIEYHGESKTLLVSNQLSTGATIEVFTLDLASTPATATHNRTIKHPLLREPNSITAINDHEFYITSSQYFSKVEHPWLNALEMYLALPLGSVVYANIALNEFRVVARQPFANGVVIFDKTTLAVASSTKTGVYLYNMDPETHNLRYKKTLRTKYFVDNLSVDDKGVLLLAGHPHLPSLVKRIELLREHSSGIANPEFETFKSPSWIQEWTELGGFKDIYVGTAIQAATTALRDSAWGRGLAVGLYGDGLFLWGEE